ncbi:hypothetical protein ACHAQJ_003463 [Trichoderma viride]
MASIKKVAVLGGSGNLGPHIVKALLDSNFEVTVITRLESKATFVDEVKVKRVDLTSKEAIESALQGQDALVSAISSAAIDDQRTIIDAAVAAKVRRFIPSEFGVDTRLAEEKNLGWVLNHKVSFNDYLFEVAEKNKWFTWTGLAVGLFFDWGIQTGFLLGINAKAKTGKIIDSGNKPYAATNVHFIGQSVVGILQKPDETANKYLTSFSFVTTQNEVLKIFEEEAGSKFQITNVKGSDLLKEATAKVAKGDYPNSGVPYVQYTFFADDCSGPVNLEKNDCDLLGVKDRESLRDTIKKLLSELS